MNKRAWLYLSCQVSLLPSIFKGIGQRVSLLVPTSGPHLGSVLDHRSTNDM